MQALNPLKILKLLTVLIHLLHLLCILETVIQLSIYWLSLFIVSVLLLTLWPSHLHLILLIELLLLHLLLTHLHNLLLLNTFQKCSFIH